MAGMIKFCMMYLECMEAFISHRHVMMRAAAIIFIFVDFVPNLLSADVTKNPN